MGVWQKCDCTSWPSYSASRHSGERPSCTLTARLGESDGSAHHLFTDDTKVYVRIKVCARSLNGNVSFVSLLKFRRLLLSLGTKQQLTAHFLSAHLWGCRMSRPPTFNAAWGQDESTSCGGQGGYAIYVGESIGPFVLRPLAQGSWQPALGNNHRAAQNAQPDKKKKWSNFNENRAFRSQLVFPHSWTFPYSRHWMASILDKRSISLWALMTPDTLSGVTIQPVGSGSRFIHIPGWAVGYLSCIDKHISSKIEQCFVLDSSNWCFLSWWMNNNGS